MKRIVVVFCVVLFLGFVAAGTSVLAQGPIPVPEVGSNHEHLEPLSVHVGDWISHDEGEAGRTIHIRRKIEWALGGNYLTAVTTIGEEGVKTPLVHRHMVGWDSRELRVRSWIFSSNGNFARGVWGGDEMMSEGQIRGLTPNGEQLSATIEYEVVDRNTIIYRATDRKEGENSLRDLEWKFTRVVPVP